MQCLFYSCCCVSVENSSNDLVVSKNEREKRVSEREKATWCKLGGLMRLSNVLVLRLP